MPSDRRTRTRSGLGRLGFGRAARRTRLQPGDIIAVHLYLGETGRSDHDLKVARTLDRLRRENA
jgi:hypothetical protein